MLQAQPHRRYDLSERFLIENTMPNIAQILKDEIARISRREIKKATAVLHRSSAAYRKEIAALILRRHSCIALCGSETISFDV
ncbi:MAG: hypothetical protein E6K53_00090 [Gammaproteobacteria bacterium]|nr:MAG: hypothetical protein E6K53_00090 [Gammaproteobacteria bacterium]